MEKENTYSTRRHQQHRLLKDNQHKKLSGVCAGIAKYYDLPRIIVRIAILGALIMFPVATGVAYVVASMLLPENHYSPSE